MYSQYGSEEEFNLEYDLIRLLWILQTMSLIHLEAILYQFIVLIRKVVSELDFLW